MTKTVAIPSRLEQFAPSAGMRMLHHLLMNGGDRVLTEKTCERAYGPTSSERMLAKAAVAATGLADLDRVAGGGLVANMLAVLTGEAAPSRVLPAQLGQRTFLVDDAIAGAWRGEGRPIPLRHVSLSGVTLQPFEMTLIVPITSEVRRAFTPASERFVRAQIVRAVRLGLDAPFLDPTNSGNAGVRPASVTFGAPVVNASGSSPDDLREAIGEAFDAYAGDLETAAWFTDAGTAARIGLMTEVGSAFPDVGPRGGMLVGVPLYVTRGLTRDSTGGTLVLLDTAGVAAGVEGGDVDVAEHASVEMLDNPTNNVTTPTATTLVSAFQSNCVFLRVVLSANWQALAPGRVVVVSGVSP